MTPPAGRLGLLRVGVALALLAVGARPSVPTIVDDLYISYAYALSLLERGELVWGTGDRVEGYSNFLWVLVLALGRALGAPISWWAKGASFIAAVALLVHAHRHAPRTWAGTAFVLALGAWSGLATWSAMGMETTAFALAVGVGWGLVAARRVSLAMAALAVAALSRPEGSVYLAGAAVLLARRMTPVGWASLVAVGAWHLWRRVYFGSWVPNPIVAKLNAPEPFGAGLAQAGTELLVAAAPMALAAAGVRADRRSLLLAAAPVGLHVGMLLRMHGDWMGDTRILLPGLVAGMMALLRGGPARASPSRLAFLAIPLVLFAPARGEGLTFRLPRLRASFHAPLELSRPPLLEDVAFAIRRVPAGGRFETADVGLPGLVPGLRVVDAVGLTDPTRTRAAPGADTSAVDARYRGEDALVCVRRYANDPEAETPRFKALIAPYRPEKRAREGQGGHRWWCLPDAPYADEATVRARWLGLVDRLPEHPVLRWRAARALADQGELDAATALYAVDPYQGLSPEVGLLFTFGPEPEVYTPRGFRLAGGEAIRTRPLDRPLPYLVVVEAPPTTDTHWNWVDPAGATVGEGTGRGRVRIPVVPPVAGARLVVRAGGIPDATPSWVRVELPGTAGPPSGPERRGDPLPKGVPSPGPDEPPRSP